MEKGWECLVNAPLEENVQINLPSKYTDKKASFNLSKALRVCLFGINNYYFVYFDKRTVIITFVLSLCY